MAFTVLATLLAYADSHDTSVFNQQLVMVVAGVIVVIAGIAFVPVAISWRRRHRNPEAIAAAAIIWGVIAAGVAIHSISAEMTWSSERNMRMMSGYFDPQENADAPAPPVAMGVVLATAYAGLIVAAARGQRL